jgi:hypothetical protein
MAKKDGKCCESLFHALQPKPLQEKKEKAIQPKTKMQKLRKQTQELEVKG